MIWTTSRFVFEITDRTQAESRKQGSFFLCLLELLPGSTIVGRTQRIFPGFVRAMAPQLAPELPLISPGIVFLVFARLFRGLPGLSFAFGLLEWPASYCEAPSWHVSGPRVVRSDALDEQAIIKHQLR